MTLRPFFFAAPFALSLVACGGSDDEVNCALTEGKFAITLKVTDAAGTVLGGWTATKTCGSGGKDETVEVPETEDCTKDGACKRGFGDVGPGGTGVSCTFTVTKAGYQAATGTYQATYGSCGDLTSAPESRTVALTKSP